MPLLVDQGCYHNRQASVVGRDFRIAAWKLGSEFLQTSMSIIRRYAYRHGAHLVGYELSVQLNSADLAIKVDMIISDHQHCAASGGSATLLQNYHRQTLVAYACG